MAGIASDVGRFSIVPEWVVAADISPTALKLYIVMAMHADRDSGECYPGRQRLAGMCGVSPNTIDRARRELEDIGALRSSPRYAKDGSRQSNLYTVVMAKPPEALTLFDPPSPPVATPLTTGDETPLPMAGEENYNQNELEVTSLRKSPAGEGNGKDRDLIWDALTAHFGEAVTKSERSLRGRTAREIRATGGSDADLVDAINTRMRVYWPEMTKTETALTKHWTLLGRRADNGDSGNYPLCTACSGMGHDGIGGICRVCNGSGHRNPERGAT